MKIITDRNWIYNRIFYLMIAVIGMLCGWFILSIVLFLTVLQRTMHEFVHAFAVIMMKGEIEEIHLGPKNVQYTKFFVLDPLSEKIVYGSGALFDTVMCFVMAILLMISGDVWIIPDAFYFPAEFFILAGFAIFGIMIYYHIVPEKSDFNRCRNIMKE